MTNYVTDDIGLVVAAMREDGQDDPYYLYGTRVEINSILKTKSQIDAKYPLVALKVPIVWRSEGGMIHYSLNLAIMSFTDKNYRAAQRYENVIKPILRPLYNLFLEKLKIVGGFSWTNEGHEPYHIGREVPFYGTEGKEGNLKNYFDDPIDAIEIVDLKISQKIKNC